MIDSNWNTYQISSNISKYTLVACQNNEICGYGTVKELLIVVGVFVNRQKE